VIGGLIGLSVAAALGCLVYVGGSRVNLGTFFKFTGVLMILFAAGLAGKAAHEFRQLLGFDSGWLIRPMWTISSGPAATGTFRDFFEGLFGWSPQPERIRVLAYLAYAVPVLSVYLKSVRGSAPTVTSNPSAVTAGV
jgi:high-affinity iron transporter